MKPLWVNRIGTINTGILKGTSGLVVAFDSIEDEATLALDEITSITISSDYIDQPDSP
jgi:hypothetical protein